jgi:MYXO-CTERM domain-containing protein
MKKFRNAVSLFSLAALLFSVSPAMSQTSSNENSDPYQGASQNDDKDHATSWGWVGLLGLAGLLGLRRNRHSTTTGNTTVRTVVTITGILALSATLSTVTPALSQDQPKGYDQDNSAKGDQRDNEDHETNYDWVGFFGLAGLVGLVGPKRS